MKRYFKRNWDDTRGDDFDAWGKSIWYFEVGEDKYITRQIELYENGNRLKYDSNGKVFDDYGGVGTHPIDEVEFEKFEIDKIEFETEWKKQNPKKEHQEILNLLSDYLSNNYSQRFGQALFNLSINEFKNKLNPEKEHYQLRDIHGDTDHQILQRIKNKLKQS